MGADKNQRMAYWKYVAPNAFRVQQSSLSNSGCSVSIEVEKTKNFGKEVGFQLDGFDEEVRAEIEGQGVMKQQK
ncbi:hypothetical protein L1887_23791 [Cichorium endivia]|nr:hypothetical protein L1887_23791 [Cichorium endivia]